MIFWLIALLVAVGVVSNYPWLLLVGLGIAVLFGLLMLVDYYFGEQILSWRFQRKLERLIRQTKEQIWKNHRTPSDRY